MRGRALAVLLLALCGCPTPPAVLRGEFPPTTPQQAGTGESVRWGGQIAEVHNEQDRTCFDVIAQPLDGRARPAPTDVTTLGRFRACALGFYDPKVYATGRSLTVVGTVEQHTQEKFGEYELTIPVVTAEVVYLWPNPTVYYAYPYPWGYWGPVWPGGYWGGPWGGPYWGPSVGFWGGPWGPWGYPGPL